MGKPKYRLVYDYISDLISSGDRGLGEQLPTDGQLMARFSVSRGTVGKAMRDLENNGLIQRRAGAGTYVRQVPGSNTAFVAVLIAGLGDTEFFEPICAQIARACQRHNLSLIWGTLPDDSADDERTAVERFCHFMKERQVSGLFFVPDELPDGADLNRNQYLLDKLSDSGIRVVLLDRSNRPFPESSEYDLVGIDNFRTGYLQTKHLLERGCKRIVYVARPGFLSTKEARIAGYRYAMKKASIKIPESWQMEGDVDNAVFFKSVLDIKPDGIVCFHDPIAMTLIRKFLEISVNVPRDVKVIGVDDVRYSQYLPIPLTTIRQPCQEIGEAAVDLMQGRLTDPYLPPRDIRLSTELFVRQSTAKM